MQTNHVVYILNVGNTLDLLLEATHHFRKPFVVTYAQQTVTLVEHVVPRDKAPLHDRRNPRLAYQPAPQRINGRWVTFPPTTDVAYIHERIEETDVNINIDEWDLGATKAKAQKILFYLLKEMISSLAAGQDAVSHLEEITCILMDTTEPDRFDIAMTELYLKTPEVEKVIDDTMAILNVVFKERYREWKLLFDFDQYILVGGLDYRLKEWSELTGTPLTEEQDFVFDIQRLITFIVTEGRKKDYHILTAGNTTAFLIMRALRKELPYATVKIPTFDILNATAPNLQDAVRHDADQAYYNLVLPVVSAFVAKVINDRISRASMTRMTAVIEARDRTTGTGTWLRFTEEEDSIDVAGEREQVFHDMEQQHYVPRAIRERNGIA